MWNPDIKTINITKLVQMIFSTWFGYFEYVNCPMWYNADVFNLIAISFNWSTWLWSIIQPEIFNMKLCEPLLLHSVSHSTFPRHYTNLFLHFTCIFTFLEIIKHNMLRVLLFFLPFSILKLLHKNSLIWCFFFKKMHSDITELQYSPT